MSAAIDTMIYVGETPWHGLGTHYEERPTTSKQIIDGAKLGWEVAAEKMSSPTHGEIPNYHTVYRTDNNELIGVVNEARPHLVQNAETFQLFDKLMGQQVDFETAASLSGGEKVFGCFLVREKYRVLDDDIDHYLVVVNDHLKVDGKILLLNTPIRVVCQNTLSAAMNKNIYQYRMPITTDEGVATTLTNNIFDRVEACAKFLQKRAEALVGQKIDRDYVEGLLDELFPLAEVKDPMSPVSRANEAVEMKRSTFLSACMGADNLGNYKGTAYQVLNAVTDYSAHYFTKVEKAYDLDTRMKVLPGISTDSPAAMVSKFLAYNKRKIA